MEMLLTGLGNALEPSVLLMIVIGVVVGIVVGALPGLTATMGVAVLLPLTFGMEPLPALLLLTGVYFGGIYGGSIPAILLRTPGTPAAAATALDGYEMAKKDEAGRALFISVVCSVIGGMISVILLILVAPQIAKVALQFASPEKFALAVFGLSIIASISGSSILKGIISGCFGLVIAMVGLDPVSGYPRFTLGFFQMSSGFSLIPVLVGLFAAAEAFRSTEDDNEIKKMAVKMGHIFKNLKEVFTMWVNIIRSALIGFFIGVIPGAGADIAAYVSYNEAKRWTRNKSVEFGKGNPAGVAAPEAATNGLTAGAFVPLITLGIPGDAVAAVMLGALIIQGIKPGPQIFQTNGELMYSLFSGMVVAYILVLIFGLLGIRYFMKVLSIPRPLLIPIILTLCVVGSFAVNNNFFDVVVMFVAGIIGYILIKLDFPISPIILALILGPMAENELRRSLLLSDGSFMIFLQSPIALILLIIAILSLVSPMVKNAYKMLGNK